MLAVNLTTTGLEFKLSNKKHRVCIKENWENWFYL